jgi:hypothetical protein
MCPIVAWRTARALAKRATLLLGRVFLSRKRSKQLLNLVDNLLYPFCGSFGVIMQIKLTVTRSVFFSSRVILVTCLTRFIGRGESNNESLGFMYNPEGPLASLSVLYSQTLGGIMMPKGCVYFASDNSLASLYLNPSFESLFSATSVAIVYAPSLPSRAQMACPLEELIGCHG